MLGGSKSEILEIKTSAAKKVGLRNPPSARKAVRHLKKSDPVLRRLIERIGPYKITYREPDFQTLVRSIVFQQLSGKAARTIFERLVGKVGSNPLTPEGVLSLNPKQMRKLGLSRQKASYVRDLAGRTRSGEINFSGLRDLPDQEVIARLTRVKGVGVWSAQMFLLFALRRFNVLPTGDLGVRSAIRKVYRFADLPEPAEIEKLAEKWRPYCSVASWYLWRSLDDRG